MQKLAIGHPTMGRGGSEASCMWIIQALKENFDLTLVTTRTVELEELNHYYGTFVKSNEIKIRIAPVPFFMKHNSGIAGLRGAFYSRFTRQIGREYDLCISAYNFSDWGVPAIHFIADFAWDSEFNKALNPLPNYGTKLIHRKNLLRWIYMFFCKSIHGGAKSKNNFFNGSHLIIANSFWSADLICNYYSYFCDDIVYPPVLDEFDSDCWANRKLGFVSIGRISPEKRIDQQIDILEKVRDLGHDIHFHIIGKIEDDPYGRMIQNKCLGKIWIQLEGQIGGIEKKQFLIQHKFALHTCIDEAFGITVAEMVKAGCIPFIPNSGGQTEIVPFDALQFASVDEAVAKIDYLLRQEKRQQHMRQKLQGQKEKFSERQFCQRVRDIVNGWFG